jgi:hypothetical protein
MVYSRLDAAPVELVHFAAAALPIAPEPVAAKEGVRRRGPKPGLMARYAEADRNLYPQIDALLKTQVNGRPMSLTAATNKLASDGMIQGHTDKPEHKAKRLRDRYNSEVSGQSSGTSRNE